MAERHYYLGPWRWLTDKAGMSYWGPPEHTVGLIDLRPVDPDTETEGFFALDRRMADDTGYTYLGSADHTGKLQIELTKRQRDEWQARLSLDGLDATTLLDVLWETLTYRADSGGVNRAKPILPCHDGTMELHLGGHSLLKSRKFQGESDPAWPVIQGVLQSDYRRIRQAARQQGRGKHELETHRRVLSVWQRKYGISDHTRFIPADLPDETPLTPDTTYSDDFNRSDESLDASPNWAELDSGTDWSVVSNEVYFVNVSDIYRAGIARYEQDLSSDDHYAQIDETAVDSPLRWVSTAVRHDSAAATYYFGYGREYSGDRGLLKIVNGTQTFLDSDSGGSAPPHTYKTQADGSTVTFYEDGTEIFSVTDTSITGNLRGGLAGYGYTDWGGATGDNFEEADLGAGATLSATGSIAGAGSLTGTLSGDIPVSGGITGVGTVTGTLTGQIAASAAMSGTGTVAGILSGTINPTGSIAGTATVTGTLSGDIAASGSIAGVATVTGTLSGDIAASGSIAGVATVTGTLSGDLPASGSMAGVGSMSATLSGEIAASGSIQGAGTLSGVLQIPVGITPGDVPIVDVAVTASGGLITAVAPKAGVDRLNGLTTMDGSPLVHMSGEKWATMSSEMGAGGLVTDVTPSAEDN